MLVTEINKIKENCTGCFACTNVYLKKCDKYAFGLGGLLFSRD